MVFGVVNCFRRVPYMKSHGALGERSVEGHWARETNYSSEAVGCKSG